MPFGGVSSLFSVVQRGVHSEVDVARQADEVVVGVAAPDLDV